MRIYVNFGRSIQAVVALAACSMSGQRAYPQSLADSTLRFEVASVKLAQPNAERGQGILVGAGSNNPGRFSYPAITLKQCIARAYGVYQDQIIGPDWLSTEKYRIDARIPSGTKPAEVNLMLQNLLAERFNLKLHKETREMDLYDLSVASGGPRLHAADPARAEASANRTSPGQNDPDLDKDGCPVLDAGHRTTVVRAAVGRSSCASFRLAPISDLVRMLENYLGMEAGTPQAHVADRTGIEGQFDFTLQFTFAPRGVSTAVEGQASEPTGTPSLPGAVEKQLGLKLVRKKGPLDVIVFDRGERVPTEN